ncbi:hypothetical protein GCM10007877_35840 [Marinibactrum halimedae]|uniref:Uncharacterized protein n=1 Tax=Marinibactrum halimedae TaxID=1444977 RepID=A0AA37TDK7_9GAMM|nr:hypothetical protein GCM10007877_35840 [Marinibactrum halimedae]
MAKANVHSKRKQARYEATYRNYVISLRTHFVYPEQRKGRSVANVNRLP